MWSCQGTSCIYETGIHGEARAEDIYICCGHGQLC